MVAVRQLYEFTNKLNPLQVQASHIESFFDDCIERRGVDRVTAVNKIAGLKRFFANLEKAVPGYLSPFATMELALVKKLTAKPPTNAHKAMSATEARALLADLGKLTTPKGKAEYATVLFLIASGLRAAEFCGLSWADLERDPDTGVWSARGIGKGSKPFRQEIADGRAVDAARESFRTTYRREPSPTDRVFFALPRYHGDEPRPLTPNGLLQRVRALMARAKAAGLLTREYKASPHLFRRTAATLLSMNGLDLVSVSRFLRHAKIDTTVKHYIVDQAPASPIMGRILLA
jgi:integrase/recombinase XerC